MCGCICLCLCVCVLCLCSFFVFVSLLANPLFIESHSSILRWCIFCLTLFHLVFAFSFLLKYGLLCD
uniref:Uncharacterized protein n=1 Tax=Anopheles darlingi TaxID=43151 RepID=A0A2M4D7F2_ANODA